MLTRTTLLFTAATGAGLLVACMASTSDSGVLDGRVSAWPQVSAPIAHVDSAYVLASKISLPATKPEESAGLHNVFHLSKNIISGGEPSGDAAFAKLETMGVKTIVSVDGNRTDPDAAARHGMRYVHVPIEYKGVSDEELLKLAKTFRELDGPFYVHCFHGKHRGPAAAAVGRLVLDGVAREQAIAEMRQWCGTAPEYEGLYRDLATKTIPTETQTRAFAFDFPSVRKFDGYRQVMIDIARRDDALKKLSKNDWASDAENPDLDAASEASQLAQTFAQGVKLDEVKTRPDDFQKWLAAAADQSRQLAEFLKAQHAGDATALDASKKVYAELMQTCTACHTQYRNK